MNNRYYYISNDTLLFIHCSVRNFPKENFVNAHKIEQAKNLIKEGTKNETFEFYLSHDLEIGLQLVGVSVLDEGTNLEYLNQSNYTKLMSNDSPLSEARVWLVAIREHIKALLRQEKADQVKKFF